MLRKQALMAIQTWNTGVLLSDSCGYIALSHSPGPKRIIIAFRGTYSITNTIIDLSAYPQSYVPYPGDEEGGDRAAAAHPLQGPNKCENCTVHAGFMTSWLNTRSTVLPHVLAALEQHPEYEVTLVGHSLGGAVAALAGLEMRLKGWDPKVTTFGEPMVGNAAFAEFFDRHFQLGDYSKSSHRPEAHRVHRVTHVDDPIPLLPLSEWGYAPHAGEVYISKPDLPPAIGDVHHCSGAKDARCIAGSGTPTALELREDVNLPLSIFDALLDPCPSYPSAYDRQAGRQFVLGQRELKRRVGTTACPSQDATSPLYPNHWDWSLIPARYRLWELFYAHRDYFWRIGLCVPGGDPTG